MEEDARRLLGLLPDQDEDDLRYLQKKLVKNGVTTLADIIDLSEERMKDEIGMDLGTRTQLASVINSISTESPSSSKQIQDEMEKLLLRRENDALKQTLKESEQKRKLLVHDVEEQPDVAERWSNNSFASATQYTPAYGYGSSPAFNGVDPLFATPEDLAQAMLASGQLPLPPMPPFGVPPLGHPFYPPMQMPPGFAPNAWPGSAGADPSYWQALNLEPHAARSKSDKKKTPGKASCNEDGKDISSEVHSKHVETADSSSKSKTQRLLVKNTFLQVEVGDDEQPSVTPTSQSAPPGLAHVKRVKAEEVLRAPADLRAGAHEVVYKDSTKTGGFTIWYALDVKSFQKSRTSKVRNVRVNLWDREVDFTLSVKHLARRPAFLNNKTGATLELQCKLGEWGCEVKESPMRVSFGVAGHSLRLAAEANLFSQVRTCQLSSEPEDHAVWELTEDPCFVCAEIRPA